MYVVGDVAGKVAILIDDIIDDVIPIISAAKVGNRSLLSTQKNVWFWHKIFLFTKYKLLIFLYIEILSAIKQGRQLSKRLQVCLFSCTFNVLIQT